MSDRWGLRPNPQGEFPRVARSAYLDPTALVIGNVVVGEEVFIGPGSVVRADEPGSSIVIGERCNVQDGVIIHALQDTSVVVERETSLAHACIVHGPCRIGPGCFVGFGSVVFNAAVGEGTVIRHLAVVDGVEIGPGKVVGSGRTVDSPQEVELLEPVDDSAAEFARKVVAANLMLVKGYKDKER